MDHLTVGDAVAIRSIAPSGALNDVTLGDGLIVNHFRNDDDNRLFHPLGISGEAKYSNLSMSARSWPM